MLVPWIPAVVMAAALTAAVGRVSAADPQWAFTTPVAPPVPAVRDAAWPRTPIDRFILARLEAVGLRPAAEADRRTLARRAAFDLTGLPPTPAEVDSINADPSFAALDEAITRWLASPSYGERWGRHWLDVVRYTDSFDARILTGDGSIMDCTEAWRYRDWVVGAFNNDMPWDEFIRRQVAGDLLGDPVATGLYAIGNWGGGDADKEKLLTDIADDQVDLTARAFLGVTLACARCHDHKFDPFTMRDYYAMAGIFFSSHILANPGPKTNGPPMLRIPLASAEELAQRESARRRVAEIDERLSKHARPLAVFSRELHGKSGLCGWRPAAGDNPSCAINTTDREISFVTIRLPGRAVAVHPGPATPVSVSWRAPASGRLEWSIRVTDADPNCGNGVECEVRRGAEVVARGTCENGGAGAWNGAIEAAGGGDRLELVVSPRGEYSCDSTRVEFLVTSAGATWNLADSLASAPDSLNRDAWWICAGSGDPVPPGQPDLRELESERTALAAVLAASMPSCHGLQEGGCPESPQAGFHNVRIHQRGRYDQLGEEIPRGFPVVLNREPAPAINRGSGRRELADWLSSQRHPLTARVIVNRVWQHHFGHGLVRTAGNFGQLGEQPSHPELLDWLACEFVQQGWSLKQLHALILSSAVWRQSSVAEAAVLEADPDNRLLARQSRRRLESEAIRDGWLAAAGRLDPAVGGPAVRDLDSPRRTLYLMTVRSDRTSFQSLFDAADPTAISEGRVDSTVAPQALFLLNHPFATAQARRLAERAVRESPPGNAHRIEWLHRILFSRAPDATETALGLEALAAGEDGGLEAYCHVLLCSNEFVYVD